ncbi:GON-4-like protein isoform X1 [Monodelphis domestica]|uniref:GON-4-like protein isoform X1 n=2 Tax=Monodelphis domestica TaxID=13616 RepID=UPI0000F2BD2F|nr:GON-4-like protein isoform X1 [Monodelphis domestica]XP_007482106.1 GON-4-like protein isoform X1 [Monodelphis domestica]XP_016285898.1 GON-4-like protein isoform X1 [Monodelphis domestica]
MLPCKKRRTTLLSSPQHKDSQDETHFDLESTTNPEPDQVTDLGTVSLPWGLSHVRTPGLDVQPMQDVGEHICKEDPSASRLLAQDPDIAILKAIDVSNTQEINLPSLESSQPCNIHITKGKIQGTCMRRGKRTALRPGPAPRDDHPNLKESSPSAEACEKINNESGKLQMQSEEEGPLQQLGCHSARLGMQPKKSSQPAVYASPPEKAARTPPTHQNEDDMEDIGLFIPLEQDGEESEKRRRKKKGTKRKRDGRSQEEGALAYDLKLDDMLDRTLEDGAKQHNLTVVNVRNILHEVITNEHVVAMMKAAISETDDAPVFEPKMTRSKLKEVVEKGVVIPTWNISPIKKANEIKPPQFVDIHLEEDDSSDEEYQPEDEEEDETAEESLLESDVESTASSPRGSKRSRMRQSSDMIETNEEVGILSEAEKIITPPIRHINAEFVPMGPPPPPKPKQNKDSTFMEKLHAVDEELACSPVCMDSLQPLDDSLIAFRTRSKMPLKDVPLGQLEAELKAPDITPDMYDPNTADDEDWKMWLGGLMNDDVENEDEADDDDDPEYNFLEDLDEPDTEDFRNDRAVRITKKEVNELMEELFEPFQDEMGFSTIEDKGPKKEDSVTESRPSFNTPQALRFEEPLANLLNEQHRTVKELLEQLRMKKSSTKQQPEAERPKPQSDKAQQTLILDASQRKRLQQQMQQHVQLLTQIYLLSSANPSLSSEANTTKMFLRELGTFAQSSVVLHHQFNPKFQTMFQPCNLKGAMQLIEDFHSHIHIDWSPRKNVKKSASEFPCLPKQVAWILATSKVFMYPELLPICSLKAKNPRDKIFFTKAEDNLLALGLKHFEGTEFPKPLISKYLLTAKSAHQLTVRIKNLNINRAPDNIIKYYKKTKQLPILFKCCEDLQPDQWKPPVEREERHLPFWLKASLPSIQEELQHLANDAGESGNSSEVAEPSSELGLEKGSLESRNENRYPLLLPKGVVLTLKPLAKRFSRRAWRQRRSSVLKPLLIRPSPSLQPGSNTGRTPTRITQSEAPPSKVVVRIPRLIQPATVLQSVPGAPPLGVTGGDSFELPVALPPVAPENGTCLPPAMSQTLLSPAPAAFQPKVMLPALVTSKPRKTGTKWGPPKREQTKASPLLKAAPILRPAPVILTVPATTVKVVSLSNGCNMIQPLGATVAQSPQTIPITTLLVSPTSFPCPLNQPLVASSIPPLIVSGNPVSLPVPPTSEDNTQVKSDIPCPLAEGKSTFPATEPKMEPQELSTLCSALSPKEENSPVPPTPSKATSQEGSLEGNAHSWTVVKTMEGREVLEPLPRTSWETITFLPGDLVEIVKVEPEDPGEEVKLPRNKSPEQNICGEIKEEVSVELDTGPAGEGANSTQEVKKEAILQEEERGETAEISSIPHETQGEGSTKGEVSKGSPKNNSSPTNPAALSSPLGKPEDSSSVDGQSVGTPAGPEAGGEKDGPEEEEEEDFDDLTQDEEDEEMSSASEESVLSVPELQETMEKLTWLASERRMSQEGDSEEENSQEENSEPEEEEEEEVSEGMENLQKEDEMMDETAGGPTEKPPSTFASPKVTPEVETSRIPSGESTKAVGKARGSHRTRSKRGRTRASKDTSKLLLLYDEDILERDPLREQKDLAFAQAYLTRVREALCHVPGKYEDFLRVIYEFESSTQKRTAVDLYNSLQTLLHEWPQLLKDFAAFLLPEQALACGLFEEQQAFEKSRKFLRQLEICFAENPSHHQKIIKVLQGCADCLPQEITELKTQMWQLLKGHDHLQDEFSVFFDHLRPVASRLGDFEEINWTEEKEYEFDGFEEVALPDVEEEEEHPKMSTASKNKRRKEIGGQNHDKETEWPDGPKDCVCSCHEGNPDPKLKKNRRRGCSHCSSSKVCDNKVYKNKEPHELLGASPPPEASLTPESKEAGRGRETGDEEALDERDSRASRAARKGEMPIPGLEMGSTLLPPGEGNPTDRAPLDVPAPCSPESPQRSPKAGLVPNSIRSQAEAEGVHSPPPKLQTLSEAQQARATSDSGKTSAASGCPAFSLSPVPSNTKDIGKGQAPGQAKPDTQNSWLHPGRKFDRIPTASRIPTVLESPPPVTTTSGATHRVPVGGSSKEESSQHIRVPDGEQQLKASEATVCANNSKVSSTGEKVVLWTREADRVILTMCQERGAQPQTFSTISQQLGNKTPGEVSHRFRELMQLFHTACEGSSEDEDDATSTSNTDQLSDRGDLLSEEEPDE